MNLPNRYTRNSWWKVVVSLKHLIKENMFWFIWFIYWNSQWNAKLVRAACLQCYLWGWEIIQPWIFLMESLGLGRLAVGSSVDWSRDQLAFRRRAPNWTAVAPAWLDPARRGGVSRLPSRLLCPLAPCITSSACMQNKLLKECPLRDINVTLSFLETRLGIYAANILHHKWPTQN